MVNLHFIVPSHVPIRVTFIKIISAIKVPFSNYNFMFFAHDFSNIKNFIFTFKLFFGTL